MKKFEIKKDKVLQSIIILNDEDAEEYFVENLKEGYTYEEIINN